MVKYRYVWGVRYEIEEPVSTEPTTEVVVSPPPAQVGEYQPPTVLERPELVPVSPPPTYGPPPDPTKARYYRTPEGKIDVYIPPKPVTAPTTAVPVTYDRPTTAYGAPISVYGAPEPEVKPGWEPVIRTTRMPAEDIYVPEDIGAPMTMYGQRTIVSREMEEAMGTWEEPATFMELGAIEQFAISAAAWPAATGVGIITLGAAAVADPFGVPEMLKKGFKETVKGLRVGRPAVYGGIAGGMLWTVGLPVAFRRIEQYKAGIAPGEIIYQPKWAEPEIVGMGKLDIETGKIPFVSKAELEGMRDISFGVSKEMEGFVEGARISMARVSGKEYFGFGYDITVPTGEKVTVGAGLFDIKQLKGMVERPSARMWGGYGAVPSTEVTFETTYLTTKSLSRMLGEPKVAAEWKVPGATWRDPTTEMMKLRSAYDVRGLGISPAGFQPFKGKAMFELTAPVIPTGGGGRAFTMPPPPISGVSGLGGAVFAVPDWTKTVMTAKATAIAAGRAAQAAAFKPVTAPTRKAELARLEREGYIVKRKAPALAKAFDIKTDMMKAMESSMRVATKQAEKIGFKQATRFEAAQKVGVAQRLDTGLEQAQEQAFIQVVTPRVRFVPKPFVPSFVPTFRFGAPLFKMPRLGMPRKMARIRKWKPPKISYRYWPSLVGVTLPIPKLAKVPKHLLTGMEIRPMIARKRRKKRKRRKAKRKKKR